MSKRASRLDISLLEPFNLSPLPEAAEEIDNLVWAVLGPFADEGDVALAWHLHAEQEDMSPKETRDLLNRAAKAENPLEVIGERTDTCARLNAVMRGRWSGRLARNKGRQPIRLRSSGWAGLTADEQCDVRQAISDLARSEASRVSAGAQFKSRRATLIDGLSEIYARYTGFPGAVDILPYSATSRHVAFLSTVLGTIIDVTEATPAAISNHLSRSRRLDAKVSDDI